LSRFWSASRLNFRSFAAPRQIPKAIVNGRPPANPVDRDARARPRERRESLDDGALRGHIETMARRGSWALANTAVALLVAAASSLSAQAPERKETAPQPRMVVAPGHGTVLVQPVPTDNPRATARTVIVPGYGEVYVVPVRPKDIRSPRQRCLDDEVAKAGGTPSDLDRASIDLKCSQR